MSERVFVPAHAQKHGGWRWQSPPKITPQVLACDARDSLGFEAKRQVPLVTLDASALNVFGSPQRRKPARAGFLGCGTFRTRNLNWPNGDLGSSLVQLAEALVVLAKAVVEFPPRSGLLTERVRVPDTVARRHLVHLGIAHGCGLHDRSSSLLVLLDLFRERDAGASRRDYGNHKNRFAH